MPFANTARIFSSDGAPHWLQILTLVGSFFWLLTYLLVIRVGFRDQSFGIPFPAICLNLSWECIFSLICPSSPGCGESGSLCLCPGSQGIFRLVFLLWFVLDLIIFYQLLRFGRSTSLPMPLKQHFYPAVAVVLALAFFGQLTFISYFQDIDGTAAAYTIDLIMAILFVGLLFQRKDLSGLSYAAAVTMLIGNVLVSVALAIYLWQADLPRSYLYFLMVAIISFNVLYLALFTRRRAELRSQAA